MQSLQEWSRRLQIGLPGQVWLFTEFARLVSTAGSGRDSPPGGQVIYWLGSFRGDLVVKRRPARCRLRPGPGGSGRPQSRAGGTSGVVGASPPASQPGGGGRALLTLPARGEARRRSGPGRAPARSQTRGRPLLAPAAAGRKFPCSAARVDSRCSEGGNRGSGAGVPLGASGRGPEPGRRAARRSRPPFAAARGRAGLGAPLRPPPLAAAAAAAPAPRPAPRGPAAVTRRAARSPPPCALWSRSPSPSASRVTGAASRRPDPECGPRRPRVPVAAGGRPRGTRLRGPRWGPGGRQWPCCGGEGLPGRSGTK